MSFGPEHVVAIEYGFDELGYEPGAAAVIDARILREDRAPAVLTYAQPPGKDHWFWFAGLEHGPPEETDVSTLGDLTDRWPELEHRAPLTRRALGARRRQLSKGRLNVQISGRALPPRARRVDATSHAREGSGAGSHLIELDRAGRGGCRRAAGAI